jgi:hypothetical protein
VVLAEGGVELDCPVVEEEGYLAEVVRDKLSGTRSDKGGCAGARVRGSAGAGRGSDRRRHVVEGVSIGVVYHKTHQLVEAGGGWRRLAEASELTAPAGTATVSV